MNNGKCEYMDVSIFMMYSWKLNLWGEELAEYKEVAQFNVRRSTSRSDKSWVFCGIGWKLVSC